MARTVCYAAANDGGLNVLASFRRPGPRRGGALSLHFSKKKGMDMSNPVSAPIEVERRRPTHREAFEAAQVALAAQGLYNDAFRDCDE